MDDCTFGVTLNDALKETAMESADGGRDALIAWLSLWKLLGAWLDHLIAVGSAEVDNGMNHFALANIFGAGILIDQTVPLF